MIYDLDVLLKEFINDRSLLVQVVAEYQLGNKLPLNESVT